MSWSARQGKAAAQRAKARAGDGWRLLGDELQQALVCAEIVAVILSQEGDGVSSGETLQSFARAALARRVGS